MNALTSRPQARLAKPSVARKRKAIDMSGLEALKDYEDDEDDHGEPGTSEPGQNGEEMKTWMTA